MASLPTPGGSDGTYGDELNAFLEVSLVASDGKIKDGAVFSTSATPVGDAKVANVKYVNDGGLKSINGTPTQVFTKYFTGTLDSDSSTSVAHGIASGKAKILSVTANAQKTNTGDFFVAELGQAETGEGSDFNVNYDDTNIKITSVGSNIQGNSYNIRIDFVA